MTTESLHPQYLTIGGKRVVVLEEADYERLLRQADVWEPPMPRMNSEGNYPASEAMAVSVARDILRARRRLGMSQSELARRAGVHLGTLDRIERARMKPNSKTIDKIDEVLTKAEKR
jgi:ribosome-binding protein aMBF1 (putative translation factor)